MAERAQRSGLLVHAHGGAEPEHRQADASRAVDLVLRRAHAGETLVEIRRGRGPWALGLRMMRQSVLARSGLGVVSGAHRTWFAVNNVAVSCAVGLSCVFRRVGWIVLCVSGPGPQTRVTPDSWTLIGRRRGKY